MTADSGDYTIFSCKFGASKWKVLPFGLTGGPASWQRFINDVLWEYLNKFCTAYLNDILIYSSNLREHKEHVRQVLAKLRKFGIQADVDKCDFYVTETKYLGLIVSTEGIKIDPAKVAAIRNWDRPTCVKKICSFISFCNFYQRFIHGFSNVASPLNAMTKKEAMKKQFAWTNECEKAFQELKNRVCEAPILCHFNLSKQCFVETNLSDYVNASVLSQLDDKSVLHPIAYFSRKIASAKCSYEIYNKELLAIIWCFEKWRPELESTGLPVKVLTNHKGLEYFMSIKKLTPRQVRWAEFLSEFNFVINYQSGKKNNKADALTRKPNKRPTNNEDNQCKYSVRMLLLLNQIDHEAELQPIDKNPDEVRANSDTIFDASEETSTLSEQVTEFN